MQPMMCELIPGEANEVKALVDEYIDNSTGIQTILQMRWLAETVKARGGNALDPWDYKAEYNRRLMINVEKRCADAKAGNKDKYIMRGAKEFLEALKAKGLVPKKAIGIKVLARGVMTKKLTIVADRFSIQAVKMIGLAGGLAQRYKD